MPILSPSQTAGPALSSSVRRPFGEADHAAQSLFPTTRYQGSKRKLAAAIVREAAGLEFETVLDAFGGTGAVAYAFKRLGKEATYNDILSFNHQVGLALIENDSVRLTSAEIDGIGTQLKGVLYGDFIQRTFGGIYYTDDENAWLDNAVGNIHALECHYKRALAWFALGQAALAKRPYNLFHRRNLYMRTASVRRTFGNKSAWDRSFDEHFRRFAAEANGAVCPCEKPCRSLCGDALDVAGEYDLVYIDPPYVSCRGIGLDYRDFYHFLEGMVRYSEWPDRIDYRSKHLRLQRKGNCWCNPQSITGAFLKLFERFNQSTLVVSYRADGIPSLEQIATAMREFKHRVKIRRLRPYKYALSAASDGAEALVIGTS